MARSKIKHFKGFSVVDGDIRVTLDMTRFERQFQRAQFNLDGAVMNSMVPFMPMDTGMFIDITRALSESYQGSGLVIAAAPPQGRFLYEGKTMVDEKTGSTWAGRGAKKVMVSEFGGKTNAKPELTYTKQAHPKAQSHWFDAAKKQDGEKWVRNVKEIAGGGRRG